MLHLKVPGLSPFPGDNKITFVCITLQEKGKMKKQFENTKSFWFKVVYGLELNLL